MAVTVFSSDYENNKNNGPVNRGFAPLAFDIDIRNRGANVSGVISSTFEKILISVLSNVIYVSRRLVLRCHFFREVHDRHCRKTQRSL